jgi:hypothetical protein
MDKKVDTTDNGYIQRFLRTSKHYRLYLNPSANRIEIFKELTPFSTITIEKESSHPSGKSKQMPSSNWQLSY